MPKKLYLLIAGLTAIGVGLIFGIDRVVDKPSAPSIRQQPASLVSMVGKPAPNFQLADQNGQTFELSTARGKNIVLFFNEGIMCYPACWNQIAALGSDKKLNNSKTRSYSVVADNRSQWGAAFQKMPQLGKGLILFDSDKTVSRTWNMLSLPSSMHKGMLPGHTFVVIDSKGIVRYVYDDPKMAIRNQELVKQLEELDGGS